MKKFLALTLLVMLFGLGCDVVAPNVSKAKTEKQQLENQEKELKLHEREVIALERLVEILEEK